MLSIPLFSAFAALWALHLYPHTAVHALNNGVAKLPILGYNTWNAFHCDINEDLVYNQAVAMKNLGLLDAGYTHVNIDDCYAAKNRSADEYIVADPVKFKSGMNALTDKIHALAKPELYVFALLTILLRLIYRVISIGDSGWFTCDGFPGSFMNELRDATTFQDWGFDYLKYDNCAIPYDDIIHEGIVGKYQRMADALAELSNTTGKPPLVFSLCEWGLNQVWLWGATLGHSWRTTNDIAPNWNSVASIINFNSFITQATNFYGRNDMDMLQLGNGDLTYDESKTHFTAWALMKSPLLIGTDLTKITPDILGILKNEEILAINQDPVVGQSISPFRWGFNADWTNDLAHPAQYWSGPSQNGTVFMLLNVLDKPADMFFNLTESPWTRAGRQYSVRDFVDAHGQWYSGPKLHRAQCICARSCRAPYSKMWVMSQPAYTRLALLPSNAPIRME
ncbi:glycoside hydrolase [Amanita rubescens]|nr:glycoside hydrolase [Amanita rubescens]